MGSMWLLQGLCGCYGVYVAVTGSMWPLWGLCGLLWGMWLLWGLCSCYGVYMALPGKWPRNSHIIIDPVTATRWPCRTPYCGNRLTWLLQNGFTVRHRLSGHIGTDTYPDTWFRPVRRICGATQRGTPGVLCSASNTILRDRGGARVFA